MSDHSKERGLWEHIEKIEKENAELREERERHLRALELCAEAMQTNGIDASDAIRELHKAGRT